jgi:hypothetical protein
MKRWMKSPYVRVSLGFLLMLILLSLLPAFRIASPDPEAVGRILFTFWLVTMVAVAVVRIVRKRMHKP